MQYAIIQDVVGKKHVFQNAVLVARHDGGLQIVRPTEEKTGTGTLLALFGPSMWTIARMAYETPGERDLQGASVYTDPAGVLVESADNRRV